MPKKQKAKIKSVKKAKSAKPAAKLLQEHEGSAIASFILGVFGMFLWLFPALEFPITLTGLFLGLRSRKCKSHNIAVAGVVLCSIGLALSIAVLIFRRI